jgi:hypothetical protein
VPKIPQLFLAPNYCWPAARGASQFINGRAIFGVWQTSVSHKDARDSFTRVACQGDRLELTRILPVRDLAQR